jgi:cyclophilin family peptidyl-prolyl cis-trans isomerase
VTELDGGQTGGDDSSAKPARFCHSCGTKLSEPVARFCQSCGAEVGSAPAPNVVGDPIDEPSSPPGDTGKKRSRWWLVAPIAIVAAVAGGAILLTGGSSSSPDSTANGGIATLPSPNDLPRQTVAIVSHVPAALGTVTRVELSHAIAQGAAQAGLDSPPAPGSAKYDETVDSALKTLLESIWIQGEASEMGLSVTPREIAREQVKLKRQSFRTEAQYRHFLAEEHYTEVDVRERVKLQILSTMLQKRVMAKATPPTDDDIAGYYTANRSTQFTEPTDGSGPAHVQPLAAVRGQIRRMLEQQAEQNAISRFVTRYDKRWRARTVCQPRYAVEQCSNGPVSPKASRSSRDEATVEGGASSASAACSEDAEAPTGTESYPCPDLGETLPDGSTATVRTNFGAFTINLATEEAPLTATSFAYLAEKGFYDELTFHRIVPDFVIQGGDPLGDGSGGPGYSVVEKPPKGLSYTRGVVAMAKASNEPPGTSGSQFFVVTGANAGLPSEYALLGRVDQGMGIVTRIGKLGTPSEKPKERVVMEEVTIDRG